MVSGWSRDSFPEVGGIVSVMMVDSSLEK